MSVRLPFRYSLGDRAVVDRALVRIAALVLASGVGCSEQRELEQLDVADGGPCGRGKARACMCEDGTRGIAQCIVGSDWSECICAESSFESHEDPDAGRKQDSGPGRTATNPEGDPLGKPKSSAGCDESFDLRAHAVASKVEPYLVPGGLALTAASDLAVCFYFRASYPAGTMATSFRPLFTETSRPRNWLLYGTDSTTHADGEVGPCNGAEPGAYLLAGFHPTSDDVELPSDVGLTLPTGSSSGLILELHYGDPGLTELLDRTGVRVCTADAATRAKKAAVHFLGSEAICIPPARRDYEVTGTCRPRTAQGDIHILSIWPHMHRLGRRMLVTVKRADGRIEVLHDEAFHYLAKSLDAKQDVVIAPGDTLQTRCTYDNEGLLAVSFGEKTTDEQCFAHVTAWPAGALSVDPATLDPVRALSHHDSAARRCLDPIGIWGSCAGVADSPY